MGKEQDIILNTKIAILESLNSELENLEEDKNIYFHDVVTSEIDAQTPTDRSLCLKLIDLSDSSYFDEGLIDRSSLDRTLITMAYCSIQDNLFNDDFIHELQDLLNNEVIDKTQAKEIIKKIDEELKRIKPKTNISRYEDNKQQIFLKCNFDLKDLKFNEFSKRGFTKRQLPLFDEKSIKVLTSNKSINQNALVLEQKPKGIIRVYLMEQDKDLDIRNLFKLRSISEETGFNLSPSAYIEKTTEQYEEDKKNNPLKKDYLFSFKKPDDLINQIVYITSRLIEKSNLK